MTQRVETAKADKADKQQHLAALFAMSDGRAWERLREQYPELAARVHAAVVDGVEKTDIWDYAERWGYSAQMAAWLGQAATHLLRQRAAGDDTAESAETEPVLEEAITG